MRLLSYALTTFVIPFVILLMRLLAYAIITFVIPFILNMIRKKLSEQQRLLCNKCHGKLEVMIKKVTYIAKSEWLKWIDLNYQKLSYLNLY